jgi:hypothetical protein
VNCILESRFAFYILLLIVKVLYLKSNSASLSVAAATGICFLGTIQTTSFW